MKRGCQFWQPLFFFGASGMGETSAVKVCCEPGSKLHLN